MKVFFDKSRMDYSKGLGQDPVYLLDKQVCNVYGIEIIESVTYLYVTDSAESYYPSFYRLDYFKILCGKLSKYWMFHQKSENHVQLLFEDWIKDADFYRKFINDIEVGSDLYLTLRQFEDYRDLIDEEVLLSNKTELD